MKKIRVLLADDHKIVREGLRAVFEATAEIEVVGEAETGHMAVKLAQELQPDVVLMDVAMPKLNGAEATRQILRNCPQIKVLVLSSYCDEARVARLIEHGAAGYLVKQSAMNDLVRAIFAVQKGTQFFSPCISPELIAQCRQSALEDSAERPKPDHLTSREAEVLQLIAEGYATKQMADVLGISTKTVEKHRQQLMDKLCIHEIAGLTRYAVAHGVIEGRVPF